jgi:cell division protein FtsI (penicillin-binding protein 3)
MNAMAAPFDHLSVGAGRREGLPLTYHRLMLVMLVFAGITFLIAGRLMFLQLFRDHSGAAVLVDPLIPARADIVDRNGIPLARTIDSWTISIHPNRLLGDPIDLARRLALLMPQHQASDYLRVLKSGKSYAFLARRAMPELVQAVNALGEPAIEFSREPERLYPQTALAAHVLGWTDFHGGGVTGMERVMNGRLTDPGLRGIPVALSIDSRVQATLENELAAAMARHNALGATGIVLDVRTGELIALASLPTFNPNAAGRSDPNAMFNRATMGAYELGSTFKPIVTAAAIDAGVVTAMGKRYDATAPIQIGRFHIKDDEPQNRMLNIPEFMTYSSNIVAARIADEMGPARMQATFRSLGFDRPPQIELDQKGRTIWPKNWGRAEVMTSGFGHGIAITPLHLACAYAALANGGIWRPATLLRTDHPVAGRRVFSEAATYRVRQLMRLVVLLGTGKKGEAPGYRVGGKTGTAEKSVAGGYSKKANVTTFAAVFPIDSPRYVVLAMIDAPHGSADTFGLTTAAWIAAPVVSRVISRIGPLLGVYPDDHRDIDVSELTPLVGASTRSR